MTKLIQHSQLRQNLKMTTSMQQSLKMLQMSSLELNDLVAIELAKNPFLEDDNTYEEKLVPKDNFTNYNFGTNDFNQK